MDEDVSRKKSGKKKHNHLCWDCGKILPLDNRGRYCYRCLKARKRRYRMNEKDYDPEKAAAAQTKFCDLNEIPCFAPRDGYCWHCGEQIYDVGRISIR